MGQGRYRCRIGVVVLNNLRHRTRHEKGHRKGLACAVEGCPVASPPELQRESSALARDRPPLSLPPQLSRSLVPSLVWPNGPSRLEHGVLYSDAARAHGHGPRLYSGSVPIPLLRVRGQRYWIDDDGQRQPCTTCGRELSAHWHTLVPGVSAQCQVCGDWYRRTGEFRSTDMPVRGRELPPSMEAIRGAHCFNCGLRPGRDVSWGRGPEDESLCRSCNERCREQSTPRLVPRICSNPECRSERSTLWAAGACGACYHYARKNGGEQRPLALVPE